ncbi:MAG TPA: NADH:flavin oxidoreductase [Methylomirabilota bacterium]|nr:NADH:flavin oxidoreductase [Methylomirabilota bacterium]
MTSPTALTQAAAERRRIRHPLPPARWPSRDEAARARLFSPLRLGRSVVAVERTWVPAMVPWRATEDGFVTPEVLDWYARFAEGEPGVLVVEATGIRDIRSGPLLRIGDDRFIPGLQRLVEVVRERSRGRTRLFIQIIDFLTVRRRPTPEAFFGRHLGISPPLRQRLAHALADERWLGAPEALVRERLLEAARDLLEAVLDPRELEALAMGYRERVWDMGLPHIRELPRVLPDFFAAAARRAEQAGFDGTELHYAHAYTMAGFLSRLNVRGDGYGGSRENRVRLPLEVLRAVRGRVSPDHVVGIRYLGDEVIAGGSRLDDAVWYGVEFARAGVDYLSVSKGGKFEDARQPKIGEAVYPYTGESGYECMPTVLCDERGPFGRNVPLAAAIRRAVRTAGLDTPVVTSGGIGTFDQAEGILQRGEADAVAAARQSLADPDWWRKMRLGLGHLVRRCEFTNYCEGLDQRHKQVTCKLWDRDLAPGDPSVKLASDGRRRLTAPAWRPPAAGPGAAEGEPSGSEKSAERSEAG